MLRPVIMIGCGGSGQKAVRYVRDNVRRHLEHTGWGGDIPKAWQFIGLDTLRVQEAPGEVPTMPSGDYLSVSLNHKSYVSLEGSLLAQHPHSSRGYRELMGWRPIAAEVKVPLNEGAGQMRAVGRAAGLASLDAVVRPKVQEAFAACSVGGPELVRVSEHLRIPVPVGTDLPDPIVVVLSSMAGGTGAGIMQDVIDLVRRTDPRGGYPIAVVFTSDIFNVNTTDPMIGNGLAFMCELMSAYWDNEMSHADLIPAHIQVNNRGPHSVFIVGRKNVDGLDLGNSLNVYRAVAAALCSWVTSSRVQEQVHNFINVNWEQYSRNNMGGYPFGQLYQPGMVSSFGAASVSIGRDRFREYARKLLMRCFIEHLHEGHMITRIQTLGQDAAELTDIQVKERLVEAHRGHFFSECGVSEGTDDNQISDVFASHDLTRKEIAEVDFDFAEVLSARELLPAADWLRRLHSQHKAVARASRGRADHGFADLVRDWGPTVLKRILRAVSDHAGRYGLGVAVDLVREAQEEMAGAAVEARSKAASDRAKADEYYNAAPVDLRALGANVLRGSADPVQRCRENLKNSVACRWRAVRRESMADAMEALSEQIFQRLGARLQQSLSSLVVLARGDDHEPALIETWPRQRDGVPENLRPSPLEFFLESADNWPTLLAKLLAYAEHAVEARSDLTFRPADSVDAARYLMNAGDIDAGTMAPLVWATSAYPGELRWVPGDTPRFLVPLNAGDIEARVTDWMAQPSTPLERVLKQGLREYLSSEDSARQPIKEHSERLRIFRQRLAEAKQQSKPLLEIDQSLNSLVHLQNSQLKIKPVSQGFPFQPGHPAREMVEEIMGSESASFTDRDTESVLLSSFIEAPVHPMVVASFTQPTGAVLERVGRNEAYLRGNFWLWRRSKVLMDFVPMPDEIRMRMISGFAVARLVGCITADTKRPIRIATPGGPVEFPHPLLTKVKPNIVLPGLLESFALLFGRVASGGLSVFNPYKWLYRYGEAVMSGQGFSPELDIDEYIRDGTLTLEPVDLVRLGRAQAESPDQRRKKLEKYIETNIKYFERLRDTLVTGQEYRSQHGDVKPQETMIRELLDDLRMSYQKVGTALNDSGEEGIV